MTHENLIDALRQSASYPYAFESDVLVHETHISWVFLAGDFAYKVKKPVTTSFLDYGTVEKRERLCHEEVRLDSRYAKGLYLAVVPITVVDGKVCVEGEGEPIEYAVKMRRFPESALLSERLEAGNLTTEEVSQLASTVANFHLQATRLDPNQLWGSADLVARDAMDNCNDLAGSVIGEAAATLRVLKEWTGDYFTAHLTEFARRVSNGFIRECHGDLHLANVVHWNDQWVPFDGIEFNDEFRWIDVISDAAFLAMDFAARGRLDFCRSFINAYLDETGDHASLALLRWYLVYRALVRAKVAAMRAGQAGVSSEAQSAAVDDCNNHIDLAYQFSLREPPRLWITHGVSGSGKTTLSELVVQRQGAIRLRSDIERKRHFGLSPTQRPDERMKKKLYCKSANDATYTRLRRLTHGILRDGYSVVVDATFLQQRERELFRELAHSEGVSFAILDCHADEQTLRQRVADRMARKNDVSDADLLVLEAQLASHEPLSPDELKDVVDIPDPADAVKSL
jgi:aminoglycoside phosphotransferase family enzyme/predicted kinase